VRASLPHRVLLLCALLPLVAQAEPDTFLLGDGHHGPLTVSSGGHVPNKYAPLTASAPAGTTTLALADTAGFQPGDLVLVHQTVSAQPAPTVGDTSPLSLEGSPLGRFELARILSVKDAGLILRAPLVQAFEAPGAQALLVPEYTDVTIAEGATLGPSPWDGSSGGVLALLATGTVRNDGLMYASGKGLRGGQMAHDPKSTNGCTGLSEPAPLGAWRGESSVSGRFGPQETGRGNLGNGGGGGICHNSGGGGGGHGGPGGRGAVTARSDGSRPYGGLGGSAVTYSLEERLMMGGGGGGGQGNNSISTPGGSGGGIVFLRAAHLIGSGRVSANGQSSGKAGNDGAGGGGAGGTLSLRVSGTLTQAVLEATGGTGGDTSYSGDGPGGGGGGGRALLQGADTSRAPLDLRPGLAGQQPDAAAAGGIHGGAGPTRQDDPAHLGSSSVLPGPLQSPPPPLLLSPTEGLHTREARLPVTGEAPPLATVILFVDGVEVGRTVASAEGTFSLALPVDLAEGARSLQAATEYQGLRGPTTTRSILVDQTSPEAPQVSHPAAGQVLAEPQPVFSGTSEPGATVQARLADRLLPPTVADASGHWQLPAPGPLAHGGHTLVVTATDAAGNEGPAASTPFRMDVRYELDVGCGCGSTSGALPAALALLGLVALRAPRRRLTARAPRSR
jgi:hypothetical protein